VTTRSTTRKALLVGAVALTLTACSSVSTNADQQGLSYDAGSFSSTAFQNCVKPGSRDWSGPGDTGYVYPAGTRTYTFDDPGDRGAIDIADKDGQPLTVAGILTFTLPSDCDTVREFHERIGLKYGASSDGVEQWGELLDDYLGQPLRSAMRDAAAGYGWRQLYSDAASRTEWENKVKGLLPEYVKDLAQGDYFTGFTLLAQVPQPGPGLLGQIEEQNAQAERLNTIEAQKVAQAAELAQIQQLVQILGPEGYVAYRNQLQCEQNTDSCVPFLPLPQGSDLNVSTGGK
jgi:hypothetical protein